MKETNRTVSSHWGDSMSQTVSQDVAAVVVECLRAGQVPSGDLCRVLKTYPLLDDIRARIRSGDWPVVRRLIESRNKDVCRFGLSLAGEFSDRSEVSNYLTEIWERDDLPRDVRYELLSKLSDLPGLSQELQEELFAFIQDNWDGWTAAVEKWIGDRSGVLEYCKSRVENPRFPESKTWVYLCCTPASDDETAALEWVTSYEEDGDPFIERVASEVSRRLKVSL